MARNGRECRQMVEAFEARGLPLFVAYYRRALPRFTWIRECIAEGRLGTVRTVSHMYQKRAKREGPPTTGAGCRAPESRRNDADLGRARA